ncbi:thioredoxin-like protein 4B isoform X1 [Cyclopterus lumpus]|uniref:thioredoxin-like protein 4B isoform X1 n=1 Tax=Cyclopterus lumpus TaxID=8103 RepID=UPI00148758CA|nr:thioredoxin-like protein 4B isoform X1 [Cyclopterus lumpus]
MSLFLPKLACKKDIDEVIKSVAEKVVVLRFGRDEDSVCLQLDEILSKTAHDLSNMASIYIVDVDKSPIYTRYFDISYIPSIVFFFNGQHMKVDYGMKRGLQGDEQEEEGGTSCGSQETLKRSRKQRRENDLEGEGTRGGCLPQEILLHILRCAGGWEPGWNQTGTSLITCQSCGVALSLS